MFVARVRKGLKGAREREEQGELEQGRSWPVESILHKAKSIGQPLGAVWTGTRICDTARQTDLVELRTAAQIWLLMFALLMKLQCLDVEFQKEFTR